MPDLLPSSSLPVMSLTGTPTIQPAPTTTRDSGFDLGHLILLGNDIAMQWFSYAQNKEPVPLQPTVFVPTTGLAQDTAKLLMVGLLVLGAFFVFRK